MATGTETTDRRADLRRRFTLLDGMVAVAALALELGLIRSLDLGFDWEFHSKMWTQPRWFFHSLDTAGEFAWGAGGRGFCSPRHLNLPSLRLIGRLREFASSIESAEEPR